MNLESKGNGRGVEAQVGSRSGPSRGQALLDDPRRNKGTAFAAEERRQYGLEGLLPHAVESLDRQVERVLQHLEAKAERSRALHLSHRSRRSERDALLSHGDVRSGALPADRLRPDRRRGLPRSSATSTAGARGLYITREMKGRMARGAAQLARAGRAVHLRQHAAGASSGSATSAPTAWASRSASCSSTPRARPCRPTGLLPMLLDIGTNNDALLADPLYLGTAPDAAPPTEELDELRRGVRAGGAGGLSRAAASTSRTGRAPTRSGCSTAITTRVSATTTTSRGPASVALAGLTTALQIDGQQAPGRAARPVLRRGLGRDRHRRHDRRPRCSSKGLSQSAAREPHLAVRHPRADRAFAHGPDSDAQQGLRPRAPHLRATSSRTIETLKPTVLIGVSTKGGAFTARSSRR